MPQRPARTALAVALAPLMRVRPELLGLAGLFILTGAFGRSFSKLELGFSWLHPTEVALAAVLAVALIRTPASEWLGRLRATRVLVPLLVLWAFGAIAILRGLSDWGFSLVLHDVGLVEYSLLVPILIIVIRERSEFLWLCGAIVLSGLLGMVVYALTLWTPLQWDLAHDLNLIAPAIGMTLGIYVAWVLARAATGVPIKPWRYATVILGIALIIVSVARSAWLGCLAALLIVLVSATPGRRLRFGATVVGLVAVGVALSIPAERLHFGEAPSATTDGADAAGGGRPDVLTEVSSSFRDSAQSANSTWRLAFWEFMINASADRPLFGVGFGKPANFEWNGYFYDRRTGDPADPFDVTGPHNSFVNLLYRTGVPGLLAVVALGVLAITRLWSLTRRASGDDRATAVWLLAGLATTVAVASFTVALEGPFMGIFFWGLLGLGLIAPLMLGRSGPNVVNLRISAYGPMASQEPGYQSPAGPMLGGW